jgi:hypothetical protein
MGARLLRYRLRVVDLESILFLINRICELFALLP